VAFADTRVVVATAAHRLRHAAIVVAAFLMLCGWVFAQPLTSGRLLAESDLFDSYLPLFRSPALVWSSYEFAGVPAFADPENSAFYPVRLLFAHGFHWWNGFIVSAYVLAGCFTYAYLLARTRSRPGAAFGALGFVLSEAMLERVPHANILHAIVWVPLILLAIDRMRESRAWAAWVAVVAFAGASCVLAGHPQFAVYSAYLCGAYALTGLIAERADPVHWLRVAGAAAIALLLSAVTLVPLVELSGYTVRQTLGFAEFVEYANTPWQMLSIMFPSVAHDGLEAPTYMGLATVCCALVGVVHYRVNWRVGFWAVTAAICLMVGVGSSTPLAAVMYELPLYDRFRIVSRHLVFAAFAVNVLAAYGVAAILDRRVTQRMLMVAGSTFIVCVTGAALLVARQPQGFERIGETSGWAWLADRVWGQQMLALITVAVIALAWRHGPSRLTVPFLLTLLAVDLLHSSSYRWTTHGLSMVTVDPAEAEPGVHARVLAADLRASGQRFLSLPDSLRDDVVPGVFARAWQIPSAGGYTSLLLQSVASVGQLASNGRVSLGTLADADVALDLLAVKYLVVKGGHLDPGMADSSRWRRVREFATSRATDRIVNEDRPGEDEYVLVENQRALPRAWVATEVLPTTDGAILDAIRVSHFRNGQTFEPRTTALVLEGEASAAMYSGAGSSHVTSIADSRVTISVDAPDGGFLVLSEAYYPGWTASVDASAPQPVIRTDLALQGTTIPAGRHTVTFEFHSQSRRLGLALSLVGIIALVATALVGWRTVRP